MAHLALAAPDDDLMAGGFLGDFVKGPIPQEWEFGVVQGLRLHRSIDAYSDTHAELRLLRKTLPAGWGRFSGILLDMMVDHYLASHWSEFSSISLTDFVASSQNALQRHRHRASDSALAVMDRLHKYQWLPRYADIDFTLEALGRIGGRMRFANPLHRCDELIPDYYGQLCAASHSVYTDTRDHVAKWRSENLLDREENA